MSQVCSLLGVGESTLLRAEDALNLCLNNGNGDFDLAFGYEAMARAWPVLGKQDDKATFIGKAKEAAKAIADEGNRKCVES